MEAFLVGLWAKISALPGMGMALMGNIVMPIWRLLTKSKNDDMAVALFCLAMVALGVVLLFAVKPDLQMMKKVNKRNALAVCYYYVLSLLYPPYVAILSMAAVLCEPGTNSLGNYLPRLVSNQVEYTFYNYGAWQPTAKLIGMFLIFRLTIGTVGCILRLKPLKLLKLWVCTFDYALVGVLFGVLVDAVNHSNNILMILVGFVINMGLIFFIYVVSWFLVLLPVWWLLSAVCGFFTGILSLFGIHTGGYSAGWQNQSMEEPKGFFDYQYEVVYADGTRISIGQWDAWMRTWMGLW